MTNRMMLLLYTPFLVMTGLLLASVALERSKAKIKPYTLVLFGNLLCWQVSELLVVLMRSETAIHWMLDLQILFAAMIPVNIFRLVMVYYRAERTMPSWVLWVFNLVPYVTGLLALTTLWHPLLTRSLTVLSYTPQLQIQIQRGVWFLVHVIYSQLMILLTAALIFQNARKVPRSFRHGSVLMVVGLGFSFAATVSEAFGLLARPLDLTLVAMTVGGIFLYIATLSGGRTDYLHVQRGDFLDELDEAVFILDAQGRVDDSNVLGRHWLRRMGLTLENGEFDGMIETLRREGKVATHPTPQDMGGGTDIHVLSVKYPLILHLRRQEIQGSAMVSRGSVVILSNVTQNRMLIEQLQDMSGEDPLTHLANRHRYHILMRQLDRAENLPISLVVCRLKALKKFNEEQGHERGDALLNAVARVMQRACPPGGAVARAGGNLFVLLLPHYTQEAARAAIVDLRQALRREEPMEGLAGIAWESITKAREEENLNTLWGKIFA